MPGVFDSRKDWMLSCTAMSISVTKSRSPFDVTDATFLDSTTETPMETALRAESSRDSLVLFNYRLHSLSPHLFEYL